MCVCKQSGLQLPMSTTRQLMKVAVAAVVSVGGGDSNGYAVMCELEQFIKQEHCKFVNLLFGA